MPASLLTLRPTRAVARSRERLEAEVERIDIVCKLDNFSLQALTRYDMWKSTNQPKKCSLFNIGKAALPFLPYFFFLLFQAT